uniref:Myb-like domain-containing protein n=1 Tax=viral metagenome TaxID=1070528 RepID=A0A6C0IAT6_9ZZZZ
MQNQTQYRYNNRRSNFDELRKNETTSRAGLGWETHEEETLLSMRLDKSSYDDIALKLKRTSRSIQTRIYQHICKLVEENNEVEAELVKKYDIDYEDFVSFKTMRQEKMNKYESRKEDGTKPSYRKPKRFDNLQRGDDKSQYITPYENKNNNIRSELNTLRQEVYELRKLVNDLRGN